MIRRSSQVWQLVLMAGALVALSACTVTLDSTATPPSVPTATKTPVPSPTPSPTPEVVEKRIVGYYTSWSIYQRDFQVADIPADKLTHVNSRLHD